MEKKGGQQAPIFAFDDRVRLQRAHPMQHVGIVPAARGYFQEEREHINRNQDQHSRRVLKLVAPG